MTAYPDMPERRSHGNPISTRGGKRSDPWSADSDGTQSSFRCARSLGGLSL